MLFFSVLLSRPCTVRSKEGIVHFNTFCASVKERMTARHYEILEPTGLRWCLSLKKFVQENLVLEGLLRYSYDLSRGHFLLGGYYCEFTAEWVEKKTGLPSSGLIPETKGFGKATLWSMYLTNTHHRHAMEDLLLRMVGVTGKEMEFVQLLVCYIMSFLLFQNSSGTVARWTTKFCDELDKFPTYDWATAVHRYLLQSIADRKRRMVEDNFEGVYYISGFIPLLSVSTILISLRIYIYLMFYTNLGNNIYIILAQIIYFWPYDSVFDHTISSDLVP